MLDQDLAEVDAKVKELGLTIIADRMPSEQIIVLDSLINDFKIMYLLFYEDSKNIKSEFLDTYNYFWIHPMHIPALEFRKSLNLQKDKLITLGRIFYDKEYYNKQHDYITKNELLTNNIDKLFKWFRNKFKQKIDGYPVGNYTYNYAKENNFSFRTNTQIFNLN